MGQDEQKIVTDDRLVTLVDSLRQYKKVAVAYSGGVDSTLLLYAAKTALGKGNVVALTLRSQIIPTNAADNCRKVFCDHFSGTVKYREINADPLQWAKFVENSVGRCYYCKKKMYSILLSEMKKDDCQVLLDGTNADDITEDRPGLKAIHELGVHTPLLSNNLSKSEVRDIAKNIGLSSHDLPSNSCLATRIPHGTTIDEELLHCIDKAESFLLKIGFPGCRVKPQGLYTIIEIQADHMYKIILAQKRKQISAYFHSLSLGNVALSFKER